MTPEANPPTGVFSFPLAHPSHAGFAPRRKQGSRRNQPLPLSPETCETSAMLSWETGSTFLIASLLLGIAPGPDNLFVLTQSILQGRWAGLAVVLGLCTGLLVHSAAVAMGVAAVLQASAMAFTILQSLGAAYLAYLAWRAFTTPVERGKTAGDAQLTLGRLYRRGIILNLTNPKVAMFFLAFLPQFIDPARSPAWQQTLVLGGLFVFATVVTFGAVAMLAGTMGRALQTSPRAQGILHKLAGVIFLALAIHLALAKW